MRKITALTAIALCICSCATTPKKEPFTVSLRSPQIPAGSAEAFFESEVPLITKLVQKELVVSYCPVEDAVSLRFRDFLAYYEQFWSKEGRAAFIVAYNQYKEDYEAKKLISKSNRKTRESYETVEGYFAWKRTQVGVQAQAPARVKLGYQFNGSSVFFTTTQMEAEYIDSMHYSRNQTSAVTIMYFTRAQAEALIALFDQDYLRSLVKPPISSEADEY
ncbi:MAG: hypothetical protein LBU82_01620 [Treponema sp.]|jgi:hypothetical protein|nr:hypothetical protein [Treponema sp.]